MAKSAVECIETNDFEEAKRRYEKAYSNWKDHWFETCITIFKSCTEWAKDYVINFVDKTIVKINEIATKIKSKKGKFSYTYVIKMFDDMGNWVFTKVGKADNVSKRMYDLSKEYYSRQKVKIGSVEVLKTYELPTDDLAQVQESFMRNYLRKTKKFYPNDRFEPFEPTEEDYNIFDQYYDTVVAMN